jgi:hypothetical protein
LLKAIETACVHRHEQILFHYQETNSGGGMLSVYNVFAREQRESAKKIAASARKSARRISNLQRTMRNLAERNGRNAKTPIYVILRSSFVSLAPVRFRRE